MLLTILHLRGNATESKRNMSLKQTIARVLRKTRLIFLADLIRYKMHSLKNGGKNRAFLKAHADIAFPEPYMLYETYRLDYERYYRTGRESAMWIRDEVAAFKELKNVNIMDWGCGPGRVIRHMPEVVNNGCSFYGTDYNSAYVDWCMANLPGITFRKNELRPPLPMEAETMDVIYGISIFTHLSEKMHEAWFAELLRVLRPKGILFILTHGEVTKQNLLPQEQEIFERGELVVRGEVKEGHRMYTAYQPVAFMHQLFGKRVRVLKHKPGERQAWGFEQDVWILEKV